MKVRRGGTIHFAFYSSISFHASSNEIHNPMLLPRYLRDGGGQDRSRPPPQSNKFEAATASTFAVQGVAPKVKIVVYGDIRFTDPKNTDHSDPTARAALVKAD